MTRRRRRSARPGPALAVVLALTIVAWCSGPAGAQAEDCYPNLLHAASPSPTQLSSCLRVQSDQFKRNPDGEEADRYLYRMGRLQALLGRATGRAAVLDEAIDSYRRLLIRWPNSNLADDAQFQIGEICLQDKKDKVKAYVEFLKVEQNHPQGDMVGPAKERLAKLAPAIKAQTKAPAEAKPKPKAESKAEAKVEPKTEAKAEPPAEPKEETPAETAGEPSGPVRVTGLKHWSAAAYTRVAVHLTGPIKFKANLLKPDPQVDKPARLYIDLQGARLDQGADSEVNIANAHLRKARMGQFDAATVRVVLDIQTINSYKAFILHSPERLIVDVYGPPQAAAKEGQEEAPAAEAAPAAPEPAKAEAKGKKGDKGSPPAKKPATVPRGPAHQEAGPSLASQLGLGVRTVVLDPGHGGKDPGAKTCRVDLMEKDITLKIAQALAKRLRKTQGLKVLLTRTGDTFIPLEERTAIANANNADLFISIHVNGAADATLAGVETYFLNLATDERSIRLAAAENATSTKSISDLQAILNDLMLNTKINESNRLAFQIQRHLVGEVKKIHSGVRSLGVKQAPFYVLLGAQMPAALVEVGFGTNSAECKRLASPKYLDQVAEGMSQGLAEYIKATKTAQGQTKAAGGRKRGSGATSE